MLVTKRMPTSDEGFVAQRFFRLGACSFSMAVWFALLEKYSESISLHSEKVAVYIHTRVSSQEDLKQVYMWMISKEKYSEREKLSVWNCQEGLGLLRRMLESMLGASADYLNYGTPQLTTLCEELDVVLRDSPSKEPLRGKVTVCLKNTMEGAVLLYENYAWEDFYDLKCGCLYLKSALHYQLYQIAKNRVISSQECADSFPQCEHKVGAGVHLYPLVAREAEENSSETGRAVFLEMIESNRKDSVVIEGDGCVNCHKITEKLKSFCSKGCKMCENCWLIHYYSAGFAWCPKCNRLMTQRGLDEIRKRFSHYTHLPPAPYQCTSEAFLHCTICISDNTIERALIHTKMIHVCDVCDKCWNHTIVVRAETNCPKCKMPLSSAELEAFKVILQPLEEERKEPPTASVPFYKSVCRCPGQSKLLTCPHLSSTVMAWGVKGHTYCAECLPANLHCPRCHAYANFQCMGCSRAITFDPNQQEGAVEGLCKSGCVLCICCIYMSKLLSRFKCGVCMKKCVARHPDDFESRRNRVQIACCKSNRRGRLILHICGAYVHPDCLKCNICGQSITESAPSTSKNLHRSKTTLAENSRK